ncbi:eCIS core domain-containing protein [Nakamurella lactea]|uniref:eCIS core domain-containing protein n=1 Tax=Nakamurella lactea TaxID=459515 RepID=UPI00041BBD21|nr:DUF4157 domain-containing protein [Nakamurella lactea]
MPHFATVHRNEQRAAHPRDRLDPAQGDPTGANPVGAALRAPAPVPGTVLGRLRRQPSDDPLGGTEAPDTVVQALRRRRGGGQPLPQQLAGPMGQQLGVDLSGVRVHADPDAGRLAGAVQAAAFTHGQDIYFAPGRYRPSSAAGQRMLAHEVSHVAAQQSGADRGSAGPLTVGRANDPAEAAADRMADGVMSALRRTAAVTPGRTEVATDRTPETVLTALRRSAEAGRDEAAVLRRWPWSRGSKSSASGGSASEGPAPSTTPKVKKVKYPRTIDLGAERVRVEKEADEAEAAAIVKLLKDTYGIDLSSATAVAGLKAQYTKVAAKVLNKVAAGVWRMSELRALRTALVSYAPILGAARAGSSLSAEVQGVTTIGKMKKAINRNVAKGKLESSTVGEYFKGSSSLGLFEAGTKYTDTSFVAEGKTKSDVDTSLTATAIHEMAHGLVVPRVLDKWLAEMKYWKNTFTASGLDNMEPPPTDYGETNAKEDICESTAMFFVNRPQLKKVAPKREAFMAAEVAGWTPAQADAAADDAAGEPGSESPPSGGPIAAPSDTDPGASTPIVTPTQPTAGRQDPTTTIGADTSGDVPVLTAS